MARRVLMVAGDPSGDHHGAGLAAELLRREPDLALFGCGGPRMASAGVLVTGNLVALSAIGLVDVLPNYPKARRMHFELCRRLRADPPDAAVLIDCGAFNLPLARVLKELGVPVLGYFPPGSWSGSRRRARDVAAVYTSVATPFPQALAAYGELGLPAELVGHPLVEELAPLAEERRCLTLSTPVLGLLPGSRRQEIRQLLPPLLGAARRLMAELPGLQVIVSRAESAPRRLFDRCLADAGLEVQVLEGSREVMRRATAAIVKSGTTSLEAMLCELPMVVVYRAGTLAYLVASAYYWPRPRYWAMPNILADDLIVPQLFQYRVNAPNLAAKVRPLLSDTPARRTMLDALRATAQKLGGPGATARAAEAVLRMLPDPDHESLPGNGARDGERGTDSSR